MKISGQLTDEAILSELGGRVAALRLGRNLTQADLASQAGVSKRTLERMESGEVAMQFSNLIRVCRALGLVGNLDLLVPEPTPGPMALLQLRGRQRQRASRKVSARVKEEPWKWGDDK